MDGQRTDDHDGTDDGMGARTEDDHEDDRTDGRTDGRTEDDRDDGMDGDILNTKYRLFQKVSKLIFRI